jgi:hypothetical protein
MQMTLHTPNDITKHLNLNSEGAHAYSHHVKNNNDRTLQNTVNSSVVTVTSWFNDQSTGSRRVLSGYRAWLSYSVVVQFTICPLGGVLACRLWLLILVTGLLGRLSGSRTVGRRQ